VPNDSAETTVSRDAMWKLVPGVLIYNLIGRYMLWFSGRRYGLSLPAWIKLTDIRAIPFVRTK